VSNIADPSGGATQDAEARTAIEAILDALDAVGIMAAS
jgi:phosphoribosylaminoimidazole carboxylase (NCAIR synthetase)